MTLTIIVSAVRPGRYSARLDGRELCRSTEPFFTSARALMREGVDPDTLITMQHEGSGVPSFVPVKLGMAAKRIVVENDREGPRVARYRPFSPGMPREAVRQAQRTAVSMSAVGREPRRENARPCPPPHGSKPPPRLSADAFDSP